MARGRSFVLLALVGLAAGAVGSSACTKPYAGNDANPQGDDDDTPTKKKTSSSSSSSSGDTVAPDVDSGPPSEGGIVVSSKPCDQNAAFGAPVLAAGVSDPVIDDWSVTLTGDERTIVIDRGNDDELFASTRASTGASFPAPTALEANFYDPTLSNDGSTFLSVDENNVLYTQTRAPDGTLGTATKMTMSGFTAPKRWDNPSLSLDGQTFCWGQENSNNVYQVRCATMAGTALATEISYKSLDNFGDAFAPVFSPDRLTLYFSHFSTDNGEHIYEATRTDPTADFGAPVARAELNRGSASHEVPRFISADGCRMYLTSTLDKGQYDVFVATRAPK